MDYEMIAGKKTLLSLELDVVIYYVDAEEDYDVNNPRIIGKVCVLKSAHKWDQEAIEITIDRLLHQGNSSYHHQKNVHRVWYQIDCPIGELSERAVEAAEYFLGKLESVEETLYVLREASKKEVG